MMFSFPSVEDDLESAPEWLRRKTEADPKKEETRDPSGTFLVFFDHHSIAASFSKRSLRILMR